MCGGNSEIEMLAFLQKMFGEGVGAISRTQFRKFLGISISTDWRMFNERKYPRCISGNRILPPDLAKWLAESSYMLKNGVIRKKLGTHRQN